MHTRPRLTARLPCVQCLRSFNWPTCTNIYRYVTIKHMCAVACSKGTVLVVHITTTAFHFLLAWLVRTRHAYPLVMAWTQCSFLSHGTRNYTHRSRYFLDRIIAPLDHRDALPAVVQQHWCPFPQHPASQQRRRDQKKGQQEGV